MASIIKLKRSLTPGSIPGSLEAGEIAINLPDKKLYSSNGSAVFSVSGDNYNLTSGTSDNNHPQITLTVDNNSLSNDSIELIGGTGVSIVRNANSTITFNTTGSGAASGFTSAVTVELTGDVTGSATFQNGGDTASISATIAANSVALGSDTTGDYVQSLTAGQDIVITGGSGESSTPTIALNDGIAANTSGNAATATKLATARAIQISGDVTGTANFDGSSAINISVAQANNSVDLGTHTTGNYVATITGTTNELVVTGSGSETAAVTVGLADNVVIPNNLTVSGNTALSGNLTVDGNLEVNGTLTYIDSTTVTIGDNMLKLANTNISDTVDTGFYVQYNDGAAKFAGLVRDASDGTFYLFSELATEPDQQINFAGSTQAVLDATIDGGTY